MATMIVLPDLGVDVSTLWISCWLVEPGDSVEPGDRVVEVLARGMTFDVVAPTAGHLSHVAKTVDSVIGPGDILGWIETGPEDDEDGLN